MQSNVIQFDENILTNQRNFFIHFFKHIPAEESTWALELLQYRKNPTLSYMSLSV